MPRLRRLLRLAHLCFPHTLQQQLLQVSQASVLMSGGKQCLELAQGLDSHSHIESSKSFYAISHTNIYIISIYISNICVHICVYILLILLLEGLLLLKIDDFTSSLQAAGLLEGTKRSKTAPSPLLSAGRAETPQRLGEKAQFRPAERSVHRRRSM